MHEQLADGMLPALDPSMLSPIPSTALPQAIHAQTTAALEVEGGHEASEEEPPPPQPLTEGSAIMLSNALARAAGRGSSDSGGGGGTSGEASSAAHSLTLEAGPGARA